MRIVVHDYVGHPFQVQLSRELARRGHDVLHLYCSSVTTPRGSLAEKADDPETLRIEAIVLGAEIRREKLFARRRLEGEHGARVVSRISSFEPDVVLSANAPLEAQKRIVEHCAREHVRFVYWVQDLIGEAVGRLLRPRLGVAAVPVAGYYRRLERRLLRQADAVVVIADDFASFVPRPVTVIENWAPLDELEARPKVNDWSQAHGLDATTNVLYAGTLGMKHDPGLLVSLAETLSADVAVRFVVVTEGSTADWLRDRALELGLTRMLVLPFQPFDAVPDMLGSADVLLAVLEPDAGVFSVPSKVLTQLSVGKPQFLVVPPENLAARIVERERAGVVVAPGDHDAASAALVRMLADGDERRLMCERALAYARTAFAIGSIADRFEAVLSPTGD
jgi:glycosyltransferase involved in cell wall biosynthesis